MHGFELTIPLDEVDNVDSGLLTSEVTTEVTTEVTMEVKKMLAELTGELTRRELQEKMGLKNDEHFRKAYLKPALHNKYIEMTIPDKPNSRLQKYRLTEKGEEEVRSLKGEV